MTSMEHCAYCGSPLETVSPGISSSAPKAATYCCYGCRVLGESGTKPVEPETPAVSPWFRIALGAAISGQAMVLGLATNLSEVTGPSRLLLHSGLLASALIVLGLFGGPLLRNSLAAFRERRMRTDFLFLAGVSGALLASVHSTLTGLGAIYYETVSLVLTVYAVGKTLTARSRERALREARSLRETFESCRLLLEDGSTTRVRAANIQPGDGVLIYPGEAVPIDGRISRGQAFLRETPLTGEPFPVVRREGDTVWAGSFAEDGEIMVRATCPGTRRRLDTLVSAVESAQSGSCGLQAQADRLVRWFLPLVLVTAVGTFMVWTLRNGWAVGVFNALAVLLVACPCALGLATPVALWNGLALLAGRGLVARSGEAIDRLAGLTHVIFDKTGTLSEESASLIDLAVEGTTRARQELVKVLAAVQARSQHPVARAFVRLGAEVDPTLQVISQKVMPGRGVESWVRHADGREQHVSIGQRELMKDLANESFLLEQLRSRESDLLVYVQVDGKLAAVAAVREQLRSSVPPAIAALEGMGLRCSILTGDRAERAAALGLPGSVGGLTPDQKLTQVQRLQGNGEKILFVGDGINDAPAMSAADFSVAMEHGAGLANAAGDAVLYGNDLRVVPWAVRLARRVRHSIRTNLGFAVVYNTVGVILAATGYLHPVTAAVLMVGSSLTVTWRALWSTRGEELCCGDDAAATHRKRPAAGWRKILEPLLWGLLLFLQGPFLVWFGQPQSGVAAGILSSYLLAGIGLAIWKRRQPAHAPLSRPGYWAMICSMLAAGNWGMLAGWWADAGFARLEPQATCACCLSLDWLTFEHFKIPWMYVGMVALGLPPMLRGPGLQSPGKKIIYGFFSSLGMIGGMAWGGQAGLDLSEHLDAHPFLFAFAGMTAGMCLGMCAGCFLGGIVVRSPRRIPALAQLFGR